jgi:hypothetical protein
LPCHSHSSSSSLLILISSLSHMFLSSYSEGAGADGATVRAAARARILGGVAHARVPSGVGAGASVPDARP